MTADLVLSSTSAGAESEVEPAWYVLTILLRIGRPARIDEIAARCRLFPASPEFLQFLCRMPNSPLFLSKEGYVTVSSRVEVTFREFALGGASQFIPRVVVRYEGQADVCDFRDVYLRYSNRKRKHANPLPDPKRRALMRLENGGSAGFGISSYRTATEDFFQSTFTLKAHQSVHDIFRRHNPSTSTIITNRASRTPQEIMQRIQLLKSEVSIIVNSLEPRFHQPDSDQMMIRSMSASLVDDKLVRLGSEVPWIHRKQCREKNNICDEIEPELVVDDSEDNPDKCEATVTVGSPQDLTAVPLSPATASKKSEEVFLNETKMENKKIDKNQRAETIDRELILKKLKKIQNTKISKKGNRGEASLVHRKQEKGSDKFPHFESFIVEEEEGSGGYGTVYRARRKSDGKTFAIKCPHPKAHPYHIHNELKMLERFGGRCFIIKYEGCFKSDNSECFVLEHVEHDRPEVLKKEMSVADLQWYGYCMFRALASLHKQGVVHRDVKPGNFLFSRKLNKGYLIDFNLALDLNHKPQSNSKSHPNTRKSTDRISNQHWRPSPSSSKIKKLQDMDSTRRSATKLLSPEKDCRSKHGEGSGVTSARDATSTRTPSGDRMREPVPCRGRKELINLAHQVMQTPGKSSVVVPVQRKRVAAPLGRAERHLGFLSPMPLLSGGIPVSSAPRCSEKRQKTEGPCVGTKGFRAPEVLLKSIHQSCKVDVWSAGVTLLYLMIGKAPFAGDPEQNIKEIAKLRGSEDLWEVAKLHNRESSFPSDLFEVEWVKKTKLEEWCERNTKKGKELVERIPKEMWDLVDRCLTVNPRLRISAEEALDHDFFAPCRESLSRQRLLRLTTSSVASL